MKTLSIQHPRPSMLILISAARHVLNSVFLDHAIKRGLTAAIVHVSKIVPLHKIPEEEARVAEDLIFDRRRKATTRCRPSWPSSKGAARRPARSEIGRAHV